MRIVICHDYAEMSRKGFEEIKKVVVSKEQPVLGLATGSTPIGLYQEWIKDYNENKTSYEKLITFNLDEYVGLPEGHPESYRSFMNHHLFSHINVPADQVHVPNGNGDLKANCAAYEAAMEQYEIDLQLLGVGRNGHIGFNEPGTPFNQTTHVVSLDEKTIADNARFFDGDVNQVPKQAVTMGVATIMKAKRILLLASGESKADAIYELIHGKVSEQIPATVLQNHPDVVVIVDEAAASRLSR